MHLTLAVGRRLVFQNSNNDNHNFNSLVTYTSQYTGADLTSW